MEILNRDDVNELKKYIPNRFIAAGALLCCFLLAGLYLLFTPAQYRVNSKLIAKIDQENKRLTEARKMLKSAGLIRNIIAGLNLQAGYIEKGTFTDHRLNDLNSPVSLVFNSARYSLQEMHFDVVVLNDQYFTIKENDSQKLFQFGQAITLNNASFRIFKKTLYRGKLSTITVEISDIASLTQQYEDNLVVAPLTGGDKGLIFSILDTDPERGSKFLTRLMGLYADSNHSGYDPQDEIIEKISVLSQKIAHLKEIAGNHANADDSKLKNLSHSAVKEQIDILNAFEPYVKSSLNQFVQLPDTYDLQDAGIKVLVDEFNKVELDRQTALNDEGVDGSQKGIFDIEIAGLKKKLLIAIDFKKGVLAGMLHPNDDSAALRKEILHLGKLQREQQAILRYYQEKNAPGSVDGETKDITVILPFFSSTPETPKPLIVWLSAFILGLTISVIVKYVQESYSK